MPSNAPTLNQPKTPKFEGFSEAERSLMPEMIMFGGAFDPPHKGHLDCVRSVLASCPNSVIKVVPGMTPARASGVGKNVTTSFDHRIKMCELAFSELDPDRIEVSRIEEFMPSPNYTINTLAELSRNFPGKRLGILIGHDNFQSFAKWHAPRNVFEMADVLVAARSSLASGVPLQLMAERVIAELEIAAEWNYSHSIAQLPDCAHSLVLLPEVAHPAESSRLRRAGVAESKEWLTHEVYQYIKQNELYRIEEN